MGTTGLLDQGAPSPQSRGEQKCGHNPHQDIPTHLPFSTSPGEHLPILFSPPKAFCRGLQRKSKGQKVLVASRCCQGSLQDKTSQSFTTSFSIRKMSSTLKAASQASKGSMLSTLSAFTGSETKGCFPEDTQNPCWSQDGRKTGERGVSGRRKTPASLSEVGVPGVLSGPHHNHLSSSPRSMITSYSAKSSCI